MYGTIIGGVVDDARARWQAAEAEAQAAFAAALGNPDPAASREANARRKIAEELKAELAIAEKARAEALASPPLPINLAVVREGRSAAPASALGKIATIAIVLSPIALAALFIRRG